MGMTIDLTTEDVIDVLSMIQKSVPYTNANDEEADILKRSLNKAIDNMYKYQKIEQIIKDIPYGGDVTVRRIQEVLEDGNDGV